MKVWHLLVALVVLLVGGGVVLHARANDGGTRQAATVASTTSAPTVAPPTSTTTAGFVPVARASTPTRTLSSTTTTAAHPPAPPATTAAPATAPMATTTTTVPRTYGSEPPATSTSVAHDTCTVSMDSHPPTGLEASVSVHSSPLTPVTVAVAGRPDATTHGTTNYQGTFATSFTVHAGDTGTVTATIVRSGTSSGSCSTSYTPA